MIFRVFLNLKKLRGNAKNYGKSKGFKFGGS